MTRKTRLLTPDRAAGAAVLLCALALAVPSADAQPMGDTSAEDGDEFGRSVAIGNFNGDDYEDLAVGVWGEDLSDFISTIAGAGAVEVIYGTTSGLDHADRQFWSQDSAAVQEVAEAGDSFGESLTAGDFNGDGWDDLAIGVPWEDVGSLSNAGAVNVIYGSAAGLSATFVPDQVWHQNSAGVRNKAKAGDYFGWSLTAGDFNGDGWDDLAIGVPYEDFVTGAVHVLHGSATGLSATSPDDQYWRQDSAGVRDTADPNDFFGWSLTAGDFNSDGWDDLAIGAQEGLCVIIGPGTESIVEGEPWNAGAVNVLYGSAAGLSATGVPDDQFWHQDVAGVEDARAECDVFGWSLTDGDFNGDGWDDLAIGVVGEDVPLAPFYGAGAVNVLYGSEAGLSTTAVLEDQFWHQDVEDVEDESQGLDNFGWSVTAGDFNGDRRDDLAVGVRGEDVDAISYAGALNVLYGSAAGLSATAVLADQFWHQDVISVEDEAEVDDQLSLFALAAGDFNGDDEDDLAAGVLWEDLFAFDGNIVDAGAVNVIYGSSTSGLSATIVPDQFWKQTVVLPPDW